MKLFNLLMITMVLFTAPAFGQESDLAGEDFDLEALPGVIENVSTFEELEKAINDSTSDVNNLDLDGNGEVDYVLIQEEADGDTHVAFLRVAMSETEFQDVATIEMEKQSSSTASFQIVGDETLYGKDYILEPEGGIVDISGNTDVQPSGSDRGPSAPPVLLPPAIRVTISVGVFSPGYKVYVSPYGFRVHPVWFRPWRPMPRSSFRARSAHMHRKSFKRTSHRRSHHARSVQQKHRKTSTKASKHKSSQMKTTQPASPSKNKQKATPHKNPNSQKKGTPTKKKKR